MAEDAYIWEILIEQRLKMVMENGSDSLFIMKKNLNKKKGKGRLKDNFLLLESY